MNSLKMHLAFYAALAILLLAPLAYWMGWL